MIDILICEDDPVVQELLKGFLGSEGFKVQMASDGSKGLEIIESGTIELVISDIQMEPMDGITLLKTLREKNNMMPFIMITGHPEIDTYIKAIHELGAFEYIQKPLDLDILLQVVNRLIKK